MDYEPHNPFGEDNYEPQKPFQTDIRKERKKKKRKQNMKKLALVCGIITVAAVIFFTKGIWSPYVYDILEKTQETIINDGELAEGNFPISLGEGSTSSTFAECDDDLVVATDTYITFFDDNANKINSIQHTQSNPALSVSSDMVLAYDFNGYSFSVMTKKGEVFKKTLDNVIISAKISESNYIAVITQTDKYPSYLTVYDSKGKECFKWANGQRITSIDFNSSGDGAIVATLEAKGGLPSTTLNGISFYKTEQTFKSDEINSLVFGVQEMSDNSIWAICQDKYVKLSSNGKTEKEYLYKSELKSFSSNEDTLSLAFDSVSVDGTSRLILIESDTEPVEITINEKVKTIKTFFSHTFVLTDKTISAYNARGKSISKANVKNDYVDFEYIDGNIFFMGYRDINKIEFEY